MTEPMSPPTVHPVPYHAQWASPELVEAIVRSELDAAEDPLWRAYGAESREEYAWWSWRLCGVACLRMALEHWQGSAPTAMELARECVAAGAYVRRGDGLDGLIYAPFAAYAQERWGLKAVARPHLPLAELRRLIETGGLLLLSVHPSIRELAPSPERRGGHLVLAVGATEDALVFHNPSGFKGRSQEYVRIAWAELDRFYAGRGVALGPGTGRPEH
ncbi:C39 family peptidase [Streptomyces sp. NPDC006632]|uniref:C39 family peptidase n=1 Tax=Streptomyces sp. NPDC006632 TaxID=3157182 RepID=UPI0033A5748D